VELDVRWERGVTSVELARILALLTECSPSAGGPLMKAASRLLSTE